MNENVKKISYIVAFMFVINQYTKTTALTGTLKYFLHTGKENKFSSTRFVDMSNK